MPNTSRMVKESKLKLLLLPSLMIYLAGWRGTAVKTGGTYLTRRQNEVRAAGMEDWKEKWAQQTVVSVSATLVHHWTLSTMSGTEKHLIELKQQWRKNGDRRAGRNLEGSRWQLLCQSWDQREGDEK